MGRTAARAVKSRPPTFRHLLERMGQHVVLALPAIESFALHMRLAEALLRRGHRVTLLAADATTGRCFAAAGAPVHVLRDGGARGAALASVPIAELAARHARLLGERRPRALARAGRWLSRAAVPLLRFFETELPEITVVHARRDGLARLVHHVARTFGGSTLHTGPGLLPQTLQLDPEGVDGDARACTRPALFYRSVRAQPKLLREALAAALAHGFDLPHGVPRGSVAPRIGDVLAALPGSTTRERLRTWRAATRLRPRVRRAPPPLDLPSKPFVTVLLQPPDDARVRLDAGDARPRPDVLLQAATAAARAVVPGVEVVAIGAASEASPGAVVRPDWCAPAAIAAGLACVTVNHPFGMVAVLAGTPLVHLGRTPWGVPGVATRVTEGDLESALRHALACDRPSLRARFATYSLVADHVWCDPLGPGDDAIRQVVGAIERRALPRPAPIPIESRPRWLD